MQRRRVKEEEGMVEWEEEKNEISVVHGISVECVRVREREGEKHEVLNM